MSKFDKIENIKPEDIEKRSMEIIESELGNTSHLSEAEKLVVKRVIHTTADFEYLNNMRFSKDSVELGKNLIKAGAVIVSDTNMAKTGMSKAAAKKFGCEIQCFMADEDVAKEAKEKGITRAVMSVEKAARLYGKTDENYKDIKPVIYVVGNAPTALIKLAEMIEEKKFVPNLVIGAPVGFVNVIQSKKLIMESGVPYIVADGRKGGSTVAAAIINAIFYQVYNR